MHGDYIAAVFAGGEGAKLSHAPAAHVFKVTRGKRPPPPEVTVPTTAPPAPPGIVIHRVERLHPYDVTEHDGIPITSVPRVLLDLAPRLRRAELARACHEAWVQHRTRPAHIEACIARNPNKPGIAKLRRALGTDITLSDLEDAFLVLLNSTACRSRGRTSTATATRSTATGRSTTSPWSCCPTASTPAARPSSRTSRAAGAHSTSPTRGATSSSAARDGRRTASAALARPVSTRLEPRA